MSDLEFLTFGEFRIPVRVDEALDANEWRLEPHLTQEMINEWVEKNPENARKLLAEAKKKILAQMSQRTSSSSAPYGSVLAVNEEA